jgi:hypothetical protein
VFEVGEKPVNRISRWRFVESAVVPDEAVLEFSCNRACVVDILVVAVEKATKDPLLIARQRQYYFDDIENSTDSVLQSPDL